MTRMNDDREPDLSMRSNGPFLHRSPEGHPELIEHRVDSLIRRVNEVIEPMNSHQKDLLRHEGFVRGFVAARDPKNPRDTLLTLEEAERAWTVDLAEREAKARG
jgi:hypothetical protein